MKTSSKIFAVLFLVLGLTAAGAALYGATHQWFMAGVCALADIVLLDDILKETKSNGNFYHE